MDYSFKVYFRGAIEDFQMSRYDTVGNLRSLLSTCFDVNEEFLHTEYLNLQSKDTKIMDVTCNRLNVLYLKLSYIPEEEVSHLAEFGALRYRLRLNGLTGNLPTYCLAESLCLATTLKEVQEKQKILILHVYKKGGKSSPFLPRLAETLNNLEDREKFILFGWDIGSSNNILPFQEILLHNHLEILVDTIWDGKDGLFFLVPDEEGMVLSGGIIEAVTQEKFINALDTALHLLRMELAEKEKKRYSGIYGMQQWFYEQFGFSDYTSYEPEEHEYLKCNIAFAFFGAPTEDSNGSPDSTYQWYNEKQREVVEKAYEKIREVNNEVAKQDDNIFMRIVYVVLEPLDSKKKANEMKAKDNKEAYDPKNDFICKPLFIIRKCKRSKRDARVYTRNCCFIIVDEKLRVYESWEQFKTNNELPEGIMHLPKDGRYQGTPSNNVLLEVMETPACSVATTVLKVTDTSSVVAGIGSAFTLGLGAFGVVALGPIALGVASGAALASGIYSIGRSSATIHDRRVHREDLSITNAEARSAYLNIAAGSMSFMSMGATSILTQVAATGRNVGMGSRALVNGLSMVNMGVAGASLVNSTVDVIMQAVDRQEAPSALTIVQLSTSILFFSHSVYNFRWANTIIEESHVSILQRISDTLTSNNQRKTFNKLIKETIRVSNGNAQMGRAEVISTIMKMDNRQAVIAALRSNNRQFNQNGVRFAAANGEIHLNGRPVDIVEFSTLSRSNRMDILANMPEIPMASVSGTTGTAIAPMSNGFMNLKVQEIALIGIKVMSVASTSEKVRTLLLNFSDQVQEKIMNIAIALLQALEQEEKAFMQLFKEMSWVIDGFFKMIRCILEYFESKANIGNGNSSVSKALELVEKGVRAFCLQDRFALKELIRFFMDWIENEVCSLVERYERRRMHAARVITKRKITCQVCSGHYYG